MEVRTHVILVEDQALVAEALTGMIQPLLLAFDYILLDPVPSAEQAPVVHSPGVAVCDVALGAGPSGAEAVRILRERGWAVMLISGQAPDEQVLDAISAGARGYVEKSADRATLLEAIVTVADGGRHMSAVLAALLYDDLDRRPLPREEELAASDRTVLRAFTQGQRSGQVARSYRLSAADLQAVLARIFATAAVRRRRYQLTARELEVVRAIGCDQAASAAEVARRLHITTDTLNTHLKAIHKKYLNTHAGAYPAPQAAARLWALELGLCPDQHRR